MSVSSKCNTDGLQQNCAFDWLEQESRRSLFKGSLPNSFVFLTGNKDDWKRWTPKLQLSLKIESRYARHDDVKDQTAGLAHAIGSEKLFRRRKRAGGKTELPQQTREGLAD